LLAEGRAHGERVARDHGYGGFDVRVGLHTGRVLLGGGVDAEHSIRGNTVNIAARMEQSAGAGAVRISHDTYRLVRGVFDVEVQAPITVKGIDEPINSYLVQRAKPRAFRVATRGIEGVETSMVGRDAELEQLQNAFRHLYMDERFQSIMVIGEAGLGKSRLLYEFENWAEAQPVEFIVFRGRAQSSMRGQPYGVLRDLLAWRLQIADTDSQELAKRKIEQGFEIFFGTDAGADSALIHAHLLGHLIGLDFTDSPHIKGILDDGRQIRSRGFQAAAQWFRGAAAYRRLPVVVLIDDLHWADDGSLEFIDYLAQVNADVPMLVVGTTRPELLARRRYLIGSEGREQRITLSPLDEGASRGVGRRDLEEPSRRAIDSARIAYRWRRRQPVLHGRTRQNVRRRGRHPHRRCRLEPGARQAGRRPRTRHPYRRSAGPP
jgi:hypothetical protein